MPLKPHELFNIVAADLEAYAPIAGAIFSRARDPFEVIELLGEGPGKFRIILLDAGDEPAGTSPLSGIVTQRFAVTVSHNRGLPRIMGSNLTIARGTGKPLLEQTSDVRDRLRSLVLPDVTTSRQLQYQGRETVKYEGAPLDAYELRFAVFAALPKNVPRD